MIDFGDDRGFLVISFLFSRLGQRQNIRPMRKAMNAISQAMSIV